MTENEIAKIIIGSAIEVHRVLGGPGLLESIYEEALMVELRIQGLSVERQKAFPIHYKDQLLALSLRADLVVEGLVLVENKATTEWNPAFGAQILTYLRVSGLRLGLILNFGSTSLRDGIRRVVNGLPN